MRLDNCVRIINYFKELYGLEGDMDSEALAKSLNMSTGELFYVLFNVFVKFYKNEIKLIREINSLKEENKTLRAALDDVYANGQKKQNAIVKHGKLRKEKMTATDLKFFIELGYSDEEIMKYFEISRSTLWRKKKELQK